jgi:hypothetical protein
MWEPPTEAVDLHIPFGMTVEEEVEYAMQIRKQLEKL